MLEYILEILYEEYNIESSGIIKMKIMSMIKSNSNFTIIDGDEITLKEELDEDAIKRINFHFGNLLVSVSEYETAIENELYSYDEEFIKAFENIRKLYLKEIFKYLNLIAAYLNIELKEPEENQVQSMEAILKEVGLLLKSNDKKEQINIIVLSVEKLYSYFIYNLKLSRLSLDYFTK